MIDRENWTDISTKDQLERKYRSLMPRIRRVAREHGYAIGSHGSMRRDLDCIAVPWTKKAHAPETLIRAIQLELLDYRFTPSDIRKSFWHKPHNRFGHTTILGRLSKRFRGRNCGGRQTHAYLDLSIIPRARK